MTRPASHDKDPPLDQLMQQRVAEATAMLRMLANDGRLLLLCVLLSEGEAPVGRLVERVGLSQPAMSRHLAKLRADRLVATRRDGTTIHYRIADEHVARIITALKEIYCADLA